MTEMLESPSNSAAFVRFSAPVLDIRFTERLAPLMDNLPINEFQRLASGYRESPHHAAMLPLLTSSADGC